ncbi:ER membrane protein complex subunit 8/9 [Tetrabaena socialis]|uniref:ER membrane protein complex subunit 8/9 n=1 Tax=Tetrabaena socialis TaxID=47790 RepID=A0A2J8A6S4_9CHLO|nr:ER membrane protein complex subunit 8/9 [Tetrabaena socialis]|eukprot:PNH08236.1 ER membrane protein complex subunit 8/9 [Tetrabaena socialis]
MVTCVVEPGAILKILAHASKFPSNSVNGALLGSCDGANVEVVDAIPLCHTTLSLAPALEIGLAQVESYAHISGSVQVVGYYQSDARFGPGDLSPLARKIADKVAERQPRAVVLLLDNKRLELFCKAQADVPFDLFTKDGSKGWKRAPEGKPSVVAAEAEAADGAGAARLQLKGGEWKKLREEFFMMFKQLRHRTLHDFEEHLDDVAKDWLNRGFSGAGKFTLPGNAI